MKIISKLSWENKEQTIWFTDERKYWIRGLLKSLWFVIRTKKRKMRKSIKIREIRRKIAILESELNELED